MLITRFYKQDSISFELTLEFLTPTFLGGADQNAELRAAPVKNLLRQWWRIAQGSRYGDFHAMLEAEGRLFGSVLDESQSSASRVRLSLERCPNFKIAQDLAALEFGKVRHPEVGPNGLSISRALYLGYGPIMESRQLKNRRYIVPQSQARLRVTVPREASDSFLRILQYIDAFGVLGSRSRNAWGSLALSGDGFQRLALPDFAAEAAGMRGLVQDLPYPSRLGKDENGLLCWELKQPSADWKKAMSALADIYLGLRTSIAFPPGDPKKNPVPQNRHILGYPVTNHLVSRWGGGQGRMPSQLRLLVKRNAAGQLVGRILHLPHKLPNDKPWDMQRLGTEQKNWQDIHRYLDTAEGLRRCGGKQ